MEGLCPNSCGELPMSGNEEIIQHGDLSYHFHILEGAHNALQHHIMNLLFRE